MDNFAVKKEDFKGFLSSRGLKQTTKRDEILSEILSIEGHFDPDELFMRLKAKKSKVSKASIYRTIPLLIESGLIVEVERVDKHAHYEKVYEERHHDHMICISCGKVIEFFSPDLETLQLNLCETERFTAMRHSLEIMGYCRNCGI
jgi:Fur family ferric uptake transcriptional regulator